MTARSTTRGSIVRLAAFIAAIALGEVAAQTISTVAGGGVGDGGPATGASLVYPVAIALDAQGNLYIADRDNGRIRKVAANSGSISTIASFGPSGLAVDSAGNLIVSTGDGIARIAPGSGTITPIATVSSTGRGLALDSLGNVFVVSNNVILRVALASGLVTTVAGNGVQGFSGDGGPATSASLSIPTGVAVDTAGNFYIADNGNARIRRVDALTGTITTVTTTTSLQGTGVFVDATNNLYIVDQSSVRKVAASGGAITRVASVGGFAIAIDSGTNLYISDVYKVSKVAATTGSVTRFAGTDQVPSAFVGDGLTALNAALSQPYGITFDGSGNLYVTDAGSFRVRRVAAGTTVISTVAGNGTSGFSGDGGPAASASFSASYGVTTDSAGSLYVADTGNNRVRRVDAQTGVVTTVAGNGTPGYFGDGLVAVNAGVLSPQSVALDAAGNLYIAETGSNRIRKVDAVTRLISTFAGNGSPSPTGDGGAATQAGLNGPVGVTFDQLGNLYIAESARVRKVDAVTGTISTVAGNGQITFSGDGGAATSAGLNSVQSIAVDAANNFYVVEARMSGRFTPPSFRVRRIDAATGIIITIAGNGTCGFSGDGGLPSAATLCNLAGVAADTRGDLHIATNGRIRKISSPSQTPPGAPTNVSAAPGNASVTFAFSAPVYSGGSDVTSYMAICDGGTSSATWMSSPLTISGLSARVSHGCWVSATNASGTGPASATMVVVPLAVPDAPNNVTITAGSAQVTVRFTQPNFTGGSAIAGYTATCGTASSSGPASPIIVTGLASVPVSCTVTATNAVGTGPASATSNTVTPTAAAAIAPSTTSIDFGGQSVRTTSFARPIVVSNTGQGTLSVSSVTTAAPFAQTNNCSTVSPGGSCTISVTFTPTAQGAASGSMTIASNASGGTLAISLAGTGQLSLVTHFYQSLLARNPDSTGLSFWQSEVTRVQGLGGNINEVWFAMAMAFFNSPEYLNLNTSNAQFLADLYNTFYNRAADSDGFNYWMNQLNSGMPRDVVLAAFMFSAEFVNFTQGIFGNTAARAEVDMVMDFYRGLLARLPDSSGFSFWLQQVRTAQCQGSGSVYAVVDAISSSFLGGSEYASRNRTNTQYVGDLYNAFLRRGGDLAGVQFWIGQLDAGAQTREQLRRAFVASPEFGSRVAKVVSQGCLQ